MRRTDGRKVIWQIAARRSTCTKSGTRSLIGKTNREIERVKTPTLAKVEHTFRVIKRQFEYVKTRFRGQM